MVLSLFVKTTNGTLGMRKGLLIFEELVKGLG
jgi:hypothetical protein